MRVLLISELNSDNLGDTSIYICLKRLFELYGCQVKGLDLSRGDFFCTEKIDSNLNSIFLNLDENFSIPQRKKIGKFRIISRKLLHLLPSYINLTIIWLKKKYLHLKRKKDWTRVVQNSDLVIFGGGALLMDNWIFPLSLFYGSKLVRDLDVPYGVFGCSVGNKFSRFGEKKIKEFLIGAKFIILRDNLSALKLNELGFKEDGICVDPAICTNEVINVKKKVCNHTLGMNILSYVQHPNVKKENYFNYMKEMEETILKIDTQRELGISRILIFNTGEYDDMIAAYTLYSKIKSKLKNLEIVLTDRLQSLHGLCKVINECDIVVGTRMHSCIISKSYGIPIIGISWDEKINGFFDMIGLNEFCLNYDKFNAHAIVDRIKWIKDKNFVQESDIYELMTDLKMNIYHIVAKFSAHP